MRERAAHGKAGWEISFKSTTALQHLSYKDRRNKDILFENMIQKSFLFKRIGAICSSHVLLTMILKMRDLVFW